MYQIKYTASFKRDLKKLSKKYPQIKKDLSSLLDQFEEGIFEGDELQDFPGTVYKVRVGSTDQRRGKLGGFRVIYLIVVNMETVHLMTIYAKARQADLTHRQKQELKEIIEFIIGSEE